MGEEEAALVKKQTKAQQEDMFGIFNPRVGRMRKLRKRRREAGFIECNVWVPEEAREELRRYAKKLIDNCDRDLPSSSDRS